MQLRLNDVEVNETPKFQSKNPTDQTHALVVPPNSNPLETIDAKPIARDQEPLLIPLGLRGVTSCFDTWKPTQAEYENCDPSRVFHLTADAPAWDPHTEDYAKCEERMMDDKGRVVETTPRPVINICQLESVSRGVVSVNADDSELAQALIAQVRVHEPIDRGPNPVAARSHHALSSTAPHVRFSDDPGDCIWDVQALESTKRPPLTAAQLAQRWGCSLENAERTLKCTTQRGVRTVLNPALSRRFRTNDRQLRYNRLRTHMYTDTMFSKTKSWLRGNTCAQVFHVPPNWCRVFPMKRKGQAHEALSLLFQRDGVPHTMICDYANEQIKGEFKRKCQQAEVHLRPVEPYTQQSNLAEGSIRELKRASARTMLRTGAPTKLWDHCMELQAYIRSHTATGQLELDGTTPNTYVTGNTDDISQFCEHTFYDWVMFYDTSIPYPNDKATLGRWLGPSMDVGPAMTSKILKSNGEWVHRSTYAPLTEAQKASPVMQAQQKAFDDAIEARLGAPFNMPVADPDRDPDNIPSHETPMFDLYEDDDTPPLSVLSDGGPTPEMYDPFIGAEVNLPHQGSNTQQSGTVKRRKTDHHGNPKGTANPNPILDTRTYEVEFPDGEVTEVAANIIAQNMYSQCDLEGRQHMLMDAIVDHRKLGTAVAKVDGWVHDRRGNKHRRKSTSGWQLCVQWKDGSTSWEPLQRLKESNPVEIAEYAVAQGIDDEVAFAWWVPHTLRKRTRIIAAVNKRYFKRTHKFGIRLPKTVKEALELDKLNGNTLWQDALEKEMKAVRVAFKILEEGEEIKPGHEFLSGHVVFDVKMEDFRRKARYVADGHKVDKPPATETYAGVVSRETVRIALTLAALNDLEVKTCDIQNAFLTAPVSGKYWTTLGPEFGADQGKKAYIVRALYGLASAGASFRNHLASCMEHLGYKSCRADPDLWIKPQTDKHGNQYYAYMLLYIDDALSCHHDAEAELKKLDKYFMMKPDSIGDPDIYLGAKVRPVTMSNGVRAWAKSPSKYVQEAVSNVEKHLTNKAPGMKLPTRCSAPFPVGYLAELDETEVLGPDDANFYQSQIGVLRWIVELGRVDIIAEVSVLSSFMAAPRQGHLDCVYHVFGYLKNKHNSRLAFDPTYPEIDRSAFKEHDWENFYGDVQEAIPPDMPPPLGKCVEIRLYVDSSHADDQRTRRSRSGMFIFLNSALIDWMSKKQSTIETSVFGAEFVAMKIGMEKVRGLRYKLRMMGVPIDGPAFVYGDNMSVIHNTQKPESTLKKKSNQICYHAVREAVAMGEILTAHIPTDENVADIATKIIPNGVKRQHLVRKLLLDIFDEHVNQSPPEPRSGRKRKRERGM